MQTTTAPCVEHIGDVTSYSDEDMKYEVSITSAAHVGTLACCPCHYNSFAGGNGHMTNKVPITCNAHVTPWHAVEVIITDIHRTWHVT